MFKLKVSKDKRAYIKEKLKIVESNRYDYVLTMDPSLTEPDKINIVFSEKDLDQISGILDTIIKGEDVFITGYDEIGQKNIEARNIQYFIVEADDVLAVVGKSRFIVKLKLYEIEDLLNNKYFIRVSKYALVNMNKIEYIKPALNSKLSLLMKNGEEVEVNRHYYKSFKKALHL
ncbi:MAG: LytTR family DNA-binding domain-containing protein [Candidatus Izemoplasmataceae bacterium]|jgi:DNA-binding LytR/AlgR family response regulator